MSTTERTRTLEQPGIISAADLLKAAESEGVDIGKPSKRDFRVGRLRLEVEIDEGKAFLSLRDVHASATITMSPEACRALGSLLVTSSGLDDGRSACFLAGELEVARVGS